MAYSAGPLDTNYDWFWSTYNPESEYDNILNDINNMGLMPGGGQAGEATGFMMDFNELNDMFNLLGKDIYTDSFDSADRAYLDSIGLDANAMVTDAFGANANFLLDNFQSYDLPEINSVNLSASRKAIIADMEASAESRLEAAAEELYYQQQKRSTDAFRNEIDKFRGFLSAGYEIVPGYDAPQGVGSYFDKENASKEAYEQSKIDYQIAVDDFLTDPGYDYRFHDATGTFREELVDDYTYAPYAKTEEETKELVEKNLLNIEGLTGEGEILDSGERATALGKFIAIGLDAIGYADIGTKLYLTQSTWNATVNAIEGAVNKIFGTAYDFNLTFNAHELAAGLLNEKFVDKDGKPILSDLADKAGYLIPFASPEFSLNLAYLGGDNLMSYTPTGEKLIDNMVDNLLEGPTYDRVQELSDAGKFEGVESTRGKGIMGLVDDVGAFVQKGGAEIQKIFSPGLSQAIVDFAFFDGLPGGAVLAGIGQTLGPQNAEQWVRYLESKGLDKNNIEEKDISYYRALIDEFFDDSYEPSGITNFQQVVSNMESGGFAARYFSTLDEYIYKNYDLSIDQLAPADLVTILSKESDDAIRYGLEAINDSSFAAYELYSLLAAADPDTPFLSKEEFALERVNEMNLKEGIVDIGNGFVIDQDLVNRLKDTTGLTDVDNKVIENNFEYIISDGARGERLGSQYYNEDLELSNPAAREATSSIDPDTIIIPDVNVVGYNFEYLTNPNGPDAAYDPLSGVSYEFQQDRFINNPGQQEDRYLFPSATLGDLQNSNIFLDGEKLTELVKQGRIEYNELLKYVKESPLEFLDLDEYGHRRQWVETYLGNSDFSAMGNVAIYEGPTVTLEDGSANPEFAALIENSPELASAWMQGVARTGKVYPWANTDKSAFDGNRLYVSSHDLYNLGIDPLAYDELTFAGALSFIGNKTYEYRQGSDWLKEGYRDPSLLAEKILEDGDIGNYFIKKYTGDIDEGSVYGDIKNELYYSDYTLMDILERDGYVDETGDVALSNTNYVEDYKEETIYRLADYEIFNSNVTYYENGGYYNRPATFVEDLSTGIVESYDPTKVRDDQYNFKAGGEYDLINTKVRTPDGGFTFRSREALIPVLKNLYARGLITMDQFIEGDRTTYINEQKAKYTFRDNYGNPVDEDGYAMPDFDNLYDITERFEINPDGEFVWMETYEIPTDTTVSPIEDGFIFANLPDFNVSGLNNLDDLDAAYQGRLEFINQSNFNYEQKDFLRQSAFNLYKSREAFIDLDESSQQLILDAQAEATSDFVDLGVFNVTASSLGALDDELTARMNIINAADLSEEQKQYEIDLANAIYDSKKTELDLISSKNRAVNLLESQLSTAQTNYGIESQKATALQNRIDKIESYELPEFNVTAYMNAEDPSAYMQNFVDEVMKGTTEEFGNFLSVQNADQILANVAALAQSETDLEIAETAQQTNYDNYQEYLRKYNTANSELTTARETLETNKQTIADLEGDLYVELDNFEVTATDIDGAQNELDAFNQDIDNRVTNGEITSEQGELEKSLATNTFNVYKATQDIASLQTSKDTAVAKLEDDLRIAKDEAASFEAEADDFEEKFNTAKAQYEATQSFTMPDFNVYSAMEEMGYDYSDEKGYFENPLGLEQVATRDAWVENYEESLRDKTTLSEQQISDIIVDVRGAIFARQSRAFWKGESKKHEGDLAEAQSRIGDLETFSLPEFNVTATTLDGLNDYLDEYLTYVNSAEKNESISAEQAINFRNIISSIKRNGADIFDLEAANKTKQDKIDDLEGENTGLRTTIGDNEQNILDLTGTISVIGSGFDVNLYDSIDNLNTGLEAYIQGINDSDLDEEMKASQIAFAESMADMRRENLFVPTYEAPDFNVIAEGDLTGLNESYSEAMFILDSYKDNEYITQEEYNAFVSDLNTAYNTRKDEVVPTYELPEFTVSELDLEGGFSNLEAEKEEFESELLGFLTNDYISQAEYEAFSQQIEDAFENKRREITPIYEAPDFTVYGALEPGDDFSDIDTAYNEALDVLNTNARLEYMTTSEYIDAYTELETSYNEARKGMAPAYELPDFSVYGQIAEGDDTTEIDTAYQNELTRLEEYKDSGYITLSEYYGFLGELETEYTTRRKGILPTYTMPDFGVTPASSLAELAEMEQAALDRFEMFSKSQYFPEDFDILTGRDELMSLIDAERARIQGTYTLPEFAVTDTQGVLTQKDIEDLFSEYESGLQTDVLNEMLGFDDFVDAMNTARGTFEFEYDLRKPIQPRPGDYAIIPDENNEGDQPSTGDFLDFVDDGGFPDQTLLYGGTGGIDTSGILTGNYMAKLDPAYQLAEMLLGQDAAREMYPTGKSRGLADEEFQSIVNQFMLGQAEDAFEMQSGLSGKMQDLATEQRRLQRKADLDLMAEFGDPYKKQLEELYPEQAAALEKQREIADISAERAKGDLSPRELAQVEQQGYLFGATRGRDVDPITLYKQLGEETGIREQRETQATNQLTSLMNMERGMYGDLPSVIGAQSPFIEGVGDIQTPFNIGGIMDLGSVDYANEQKLKEVNMAIAQLDRDYQTAVALNQPSKAQSTLVKLNQFKAEADALSAGLSAGAEAFGTLKSIGGGIMNLFNPSSGSTNRNSFNYGSTTPVDYTDKGSFERYLFGMGF